MIRIRTDDNLMIAEFNGVSEKYTLMALADGRLPNERLAGKFKDPKIKMAYRLTDNSVICPPGIDKFFMWEGYKVFVLED